MSAQVQGPIANAWCAKTGPDVFFQRATKRRLMHQMERGILSHQPSALLQHSALQMLLDVDLVDLVDLCLMWMLLVVVVAAQALRGVQNCMDLCLMWMLLVVVVAAQRVR